MGVQGVKGAWHMHIFSQRKKQLAKPQEAQIAPVGASIYKFSVIKFWFVSDTV